MHRLLTLLVLLVAALALPAQAFAAAQPASEVPASREQIRLSFAPVVREVAPSVVNIFSRRTVTERARSPLFDDPFFGRFFGEDFFSFGPPRERVQSSLGSGVVMRSDGLIVTNHHVVEGGGEITVALPDRREFAAQVVLADERTDLAVLKIDTGGEELPALELMNSDELQVGDLVLALGNPFGVGQTVTSGIVSALARTRVGVSDYQFFIQTDAAINPGNSGGALVTMDGRLAGVNTAIYSRSGGSVGIGFAIPANMVASVINAAVNGGEIRRPWLGASGQLVTADLAASLGLDRPGGVLINEIYAGGPADRAGLRRGDIVKAIDDHRVDDPRGLSYRIAVLPVGTQAVLHVVREGERLDLAVDLVPAPEEPPRSVTDVEGRNPLAGARVASLSPALAEELGFDALRFARGVIVLGVARFSPAQQARVRPGDVIVEVNGAAIRTVADLLAALNGADTWSIHLRRGDQDFQLTAHG